MSADVPHRRATVFHAVEYRRSRLGFVQSVVDGNTDHSQLGKVRRKGVLTVRTQSGPAASMNGEEAHPTITRLKSFRLEDIQMQLAIADPLVDDNPESA